MMNTTEFRCKLKFIGWENKIKRRESMWASEDGRHRLYFSTAVIITIFNGYQKKYPYIGTDCQIILDEILEL